MNEIGLQTTSIVVEDPNALRTFSAIYCSPRQNQQGQIYRILQNSRKQICIRWRLQCETSPMGFQIENNKRMGTSKMNADQQLRTNNCCPTDIKNARSPRLLCNKKIFHLKRLVLFRAYF